MEFVEKDVEHNVIDFDFMFGSGAKVTITLDLDAGDTWEEQPDRFKLHIAPKPNALDPSEKTDEEDLEVFKAGLAAKGTTRRKQRQPTDEELFNRLETIHQLAKGVQ